MGETFAMSVLVRAAGLAVAGALAGSGSAGPFTIGDSRITESSGLAASRAHPGVYWTHNDSDDGPYIYAVDSATGKTVATVTLRGVHPRDVEAISVGPHNEVYVGDIGDNLGGAWSEVWIYRFHEPGRLRDVTVTPTRYTVRYADGPRDAESLMVHPKTGRVYIASKSDRGKGGIYEGPPDLTPSGINTFHRIARTKVWATDGAFSPDGSRLVLRGYFSGEMYRWRHGEPSPLGAVTEPMQQQGESVTFAPGGRTLMFGSEGEDSSVEPVDLDGALLPESAAARDAHRGGDDASGKGDGKGAGGGAQQNGDGRGAEGSAGGRNVVIGGIVIALVYALWRGLRRLGRRGD
jgi:hypothetical protein